VLRAWVNTRTSCEAPAERTCQYIRVLYATRRPRREEGIDPRPAYHHEGRIAPDLGDDGTPRCA
jgi:hypothetical protein